MKRGEAEIDEHDVVAGFHGEVDKVFLHLREEDCTFVSKDCMLHKDEEAAEQAIRRFFARHILDNHRQRWCCRRAENAFRLVRLALLGILSLPGRLSFRWHVRTLNRWMSTRMEWGSLCSVETISRLIRHD